MSRRRDEILGRHRDAILEIAHRRGATSIALAGSIARGEDTDESDADFVCDFGPQVSLWDVAGLWMELVELLECKVDVATAKMLTGNARSMLDDAIPL